MLNTSGVAAVARSVTSAADLAAYDALVVGSAAYFGSWMKEAVTFARRNWDALASRACPDAT